MEVRCDGLQTWRSGVWVASMEVRCDGLQAKKVRSGRLQAWRSGVMGCKNGGQM